MNFFRTHCAPIAWILYAVVLFNGLACSMGHDQMLGTFVSKQLVPASHEGHGMSAMHGGHHEMHMAMDASSKKTDLPGSMNMQSGDCSFAGTLTLAMIFFVALGWLLRIRTPRIRLPDFRSGTLSRHVFPGLNPHAP